MKDSKRYPILTQQQMKHKIQREEQYRFQVFMEKNGWKQRIVYCCGFRIWTKGDDIIKQNINGFLWNESLFSEKDFYKKLGYK